MSRLHRYCRLGDTEAIAACLAEGDDVNRVGVRGRRPLTDAAHAGHTDAIRLLLDAGADLAGAGGVALHLAAMHGHLDVVALLLERGVDVNAASPDGRTPVLCAALLNHTEVVAYLRDHGADMTGRDRDGKTADEWLAEGGVFGPTIAEESHLITPQPAGEWALGMIHKFMSDGSTAEEFAAKHGRFIPIWGFIRYEFSDAVIQAWVLRVWEILSTQELLDDVEERYLQGDELEQARKHRARRERRRRRLDAGRRFRR